MTVKTQVIRWNDHQLMTNDNQLITDYPTNDYSMDWFKGKS